MVVVWWRHQNKNISLCFNTDSLGCLVNPWWLEFSNFCGMSHLWKNLRKLIYSLDLINCWWLKLKANEPIITLVLDTRWHSQNRSIFWVQVDYFCWRKYWWLKIHRFFLGGRAMTNKTIITLKIYLWKRNQKLNCFLKAWFTLFIW